MDHKELLASAKDEKLDEYEEVKMETECTGRSWIHVNMEEVLQNRNEDKNLELRNAAEGASIKIEEVDYEEIIKTETEVIEESCDYHYLVSKELSQNENETGNRESGNAVEQLLNENCGIKYFQGRPKICEGINYLSSNHQTNNKNGKMHEKFVGFNEKEKVFQQDRIDHTKTNEKEVDCLATNIRKEQVMVHQKTFSEKDVTMNDKNGKKQKFECSVYLRRITKESSLLPTETKIHKCDKCSYKSVQKSRLLYHIKSCHTIEKLYKCNDCSYIAVLKHHLLSHTKSCHTLEKPYKCNKCSYAAVQKANLLTHIKFRHTMEKSYKCNECSYATVLKRDLLYHINSCHTKVKPYKCNDCSYAAVRQADLQIHIKSCHTKEKSYKCNECSYASVQKRALLCHIRSRHTMEKPYKCTECSHASVRKANLLFHIKSCHIMDKSYKCSECSYAAVRNADLLLHIKSRHTMEKAYKCTECSYTAVRNNQLLSHIKSHHTMEKP